MEKTEEFSYKDVILASDCGWSSELSVIGAFQKVQNAICSYMESFHLDGLTLKKEYNATWIFAKNKLTLFKDLKWNEAFTAKCFFSRKTRVSCIADIVLYNDADEICLYSQIELCAIDLETTKLRRLSTVGFDVIEPKEALIETSFEKAEPENPVKISTRSVAITNIDYNHHTNNIEYIRFILDTYGVELFEKKRIASFQIDYINQSRIYDELTIYKASNGNMDTVIIKNGEQLIVRCHIQFEEKHGLEE